MLPRLVTHLALAGLLLALAWLAQRSDGLGGRPLVVIWSEDPGDYDPQRTTHPVAESIFRHVCEPLFYRDQDGSVRGLLAEDEIEYGGDGRRFTVRLRPGIVFHNGLPLDAAAVQRSFERLQRLGASPLLNDLRDVTVLAQPDGQSVTFLLPEPDYEFARLVLTSPYAAIVFCQPGGAGEPAFVVGTGPYRFEPSLYRPGQSLTLVRNPEYRWPPAHFANRGAAHILQLCFIFEATRDSRLDALLDSRGCVLSLSQEDLATVSALQRFRLYEATGGVTYLGLNLQRPRWQDVRARQAVALAMDKAALANLGPFLVADTPLAPGAVGYDPRAAAFGYGYEPGRSRALLAQAGFDTRAEVVLLIPESQTYRQLASVVQGQLQAIGLGVRIREVPRADILDKRQDFDLLLFDYAWNDYTALGIFLGPGPRNLLGYPSGDVADLVARARATADLERRQEFVLGAQRIVLQQAIWQPLLVRRITFAVDSACVCGELPSPEGELLFHDADTNVWRHRPRGPSSWKIMNPHRLS